MSAVTAVGASRRKAEIEASLRRQWRMIADAVVTYRLAEPGTSARIYLDPTLLLGRAEQQGLADPSAAAAASPRMLAALQECVDAVNADLPAADAIVSFAIAVRSGPIAD